MAEKSYVVTAPSVLVYNTGRTSAVTLDRGAAVPSDADPDHVKLLFERELIAEGKAEGGVASDPDAPPPFTAPKGRSGGGSQQSSQSALPPPPADEAPAGNASLEDWQAYALKQDGVTEESIKDLGRDELRELFGPKQS